MTVVRLAVGERRAGGDDLVLVDIDHRVHLDEFARVLERHEVRRLLGDVQKQRERRVIAQVLHLTLGTVHGAVLCRACAGIVLCLLCALVGEQEADVALVAADARHTRVEVDVIALGKVVVAVGRDRHVTLTEDGVPEAVVILAVIVVLLDDELGRVDVVDPRGRLFIVFALARDGVDEHRAVVVRAAEQADGLFLLGADPVGRAVLVDLEDRFFKHIGRVRKAQVAVEVAGEVLGGRVLHALIKAHDLDVLRDHVDDKVGGQPLRAVVEPLDDVAVAQRRDAHGTAVVVDLRVVFRDLELRDHVGQLAELAVAELFGAVAVEHRDAVIRDLFNFACKAAAVDRQQRLIVLGPQHDPRCQRADERRDDHQRHDDKGHGALLFDEREVALGPRALKTGGEERADAVRDAKQQHETVELFGMQVDGGYLHVEEDCADKQRDERVDRDAAALAADRLAGLALLFGLGRGVRVELKAAGVRAGKFDIHRIFPF